jgi:hypothetical protein
LLELPVSGPAFAPFTLAYQYNALTHGRPVVNGYSGYGSLLQDFLGGPASPLSEPDQVPAVLEGLSRIGVRHVVLHRGTWDDWPGWRPQELTAAIAGATGHIDEERYFTGTWAWRLSPPRSARRPPGGTLVPLAPGAFAIMASALPERLPAAFDGDLRTRWFTGAPQTGREWLRVEFARELDLGRIVFDMDHVGVGDYPRTLSVESEAGDGVRRTLFAGPIVAHLIEGMATTPGHAPVILDLPPNTTRVLWIRQLGLTRTWYWGINEMALFRR